MTILILQAYNTRNHSFRGEFDIIPSRLQYKTATSTKGVLIKVEQTWRRKDGSGAQSLD